MSRVTSNPIWDYFQRNISSGTCIVCRRDISLGSDKPAKQTTSTLKSHLRNLHPIAYDGFSKLQQEYAEYKAQNVNVRRRAKRKQQQAAAGDKIEKKKSGRKRKIDKHGELMEVKDFIEVVNDPLNNEYGEYYRNAETTMALNSIAVENADEGEATVGNDEIEIDIYDNNGSITETKTEDIKPTSRKCAEHALARRIDSAILDLMIVDLLPFDIVEGAAFKRLQFADPCRPSKYPVKSVDFYRNTLMPEAYENVRRKLQINLEQAECISLSRAKWSHPTLTTLHVISGSFLHENQKQIVILHITPKTLDSVNILDLCRKFNIIDKLHMLVEKNVNGSTDFSDGDDWFNRQQCSAQLLENVVHEAVMTIESIMLLKSKCHSIGEHFQDSTTASQHLRECQEQSGLPQKELLTNPPDALWFQTFLMWERIVEEKAALEVYVQQYVDIEPPTAYEHQQLESLVPLLRIFYFAWLDLNASTSSSSLIIPILAMLNSKLCINEMTDSYDTKCFKKNLKHSLEKHFDFVQQSSSLIISTLLDPRFKIKYLNQRQISLCHTEMCHSLRSALNLEEDAYAAPSLTSLPTSSFSLDTNTSDLWESHDTSTSTQQNDNESIYIAFEQQLNFYLREPLVARNANIYQYWNIAPYEYLRKLAYKYLSSPATSLSSFEVLDSIGSLYAERRLPVKNCDVEEDEKLLFMSCNISLFNFIY